jgi:hypothetical protein
VIDIGRLLDLLKLDLGSFSERARAQAPEVLAPELHAVLTSANGSKQPPELAIVYLLARASLAEPPPLEPAITQLACEWLQPRWKESALVQAALADASADQLEELFEQIIVHCPSAVAIPITGTMALSDDRRERILRRIATDPRDDVREHLFALWGRHHRLVPPGSLEVMSLRLEALDELLRAGIDDPSPGVRQKAIAAAYGLGASERLRDRLVAHVADGDMRVRQYALISLGVMHDAESLAILLDRLANGEEDDATPAIWALARRPEGLPHVLALAGDPRPWVENELLGAFAEVSAPLSDEQIEQLAGLIKSPAFPRLRERHLDRTRRGVPEVGPHARLSYVLKK